MKASTRRYGTAVLLTALVASGCYRATFYRDPSAVKGAQHERWTDFYLFGLVGTESFDVHDFCPAGQVAQVQTGGNFGTGIVGVLTIGIYTPRKVYVTCAAKSGTGSSAQTERLEIEPDGAGRPVRAWWHDGSRLVAARIESVGDQVWRVSRESEVAQ